MQKKNLLILYSSNTDNEDYKVFSDCYDLFSSDKLTSPYPALKHTRESLAVTLDTISNFNVNSERYCKIHETAHETETEDCFTHIYAHAWLEPQETLQNVPIDHYTSKWFDSEFEKIVEAKEMKSKDTFIEVVIDIFEKRTSRKDYARLADDLLDILSRRLQLFFPTNKNKFKRSLIQKLEKSKIPLDISHSEKDVWLMSSRHVLNEFLQWFTAESTSDVGVTDSSPFVFRHAGDFWIVRFAGKEIFIKDGLGPKYIWQLLLKPNKPIEVDELYALVGGKSRKKVSRKNVSNVSAIAAGLTEVSTVGSKGDELIIDIECRQKIKKELLSLKVEIDGAEKNYDIGRTKKLKEDMRELEQEYFRPVIDGRGKVRPFSNVLESIRITVSRRIDGTIEDIQKKGLSECASHLLNAIDKGKSPCYKPQSEISWELY